MRRFLIIDGNSLIHRAFHALPLLSDSEGRVVNAVYGFFSVLIRVVKEREPDCIAVAFDLPGPTFRHHEYKEYKATRKPTADELIGQFSIVKEGLTLLDIPIIEREGFEADDMIGSIVVDGYSLIATGDRDLLQLINDKREVLLFKNGVKDEVLYNRELFQEEYGKIAPNQLIEVKALQGDVSDNIPGVAGIGAKTARELISKFGRLEKIYESLDQLPPATRERLIEGEESAFLSRRLSTIKTDLEIDLKDCHWQGFGRAEEFFKRLGFTSLLKRIDEFKNLSLF